MWTQLPAAKSLELYLEVVATCTPRKVRCELPFDQTSAAMFLAQPAMSRQNVRLRRDQVGHWGHEYRNPLTCFRFDEVEKVIQ